MRTVDYLLLFSLVLQLAFGLRLLLGPVRIGWRPRMARLVGGSWSR